jgi:hypothetical protein
MVFLSVEDKRYAATPLNILVLTPYRNLVTSFMELGGVYSWENSRGMNVLEGLLVFKVVSPPLFQLLVRNLSY